MKNNNHVLIFFWFQKTAIISWKSCCHGYVASNTWETVPGQKYMVNFDQQIIVAGTSRQHFGSK
jgi:hypothetical protein